MKLGEHAGVRLASMDRLFTDLSRDRPGLEMNLRRLEEIVTQGIGMTIRDFLDGR